MTCIIECKREHLFVSVCGAVQYLSINVFRNFPSFFSLPIVGLVLLVTHGLFSSRLHLGLLFGQEGKRESQKGGQREGIACKSRTTNCVKGASNKTTLLAILLPKMGITPKMLLLNIVKRKASFLPQNFAQGFLSESSQERARGKEAASVLISQLRMYFLASSNSIRVRMVYSYSPPLGYVFSTVHSVRTYYAIFL